LIRYPDYLRHESSNYALNVDYGRNRGTIVIFVLFHFCERRDEKRREEKRREEKREEGENKPSYHQSYIIKSSFITKET